MRLWSIHPHYLDAKGLVALWREALLAQNVLLGKTRGYQHHPQLNRFRQCESPEIAIATYLRRVAEEADARGYNFDKRKILTNGNVNPIAVTTEQLQYEFEHLKRKLKSRDHTTFETLQRVSEIQPHPLFVKVLGPVEPWEVVH